MAKCATLWHAGGTDARPAVCPETPPQKKPRLTTVTVLRVRFLARSLAFRTRPTRERRSVAAGVFKHRSSVRSRHARPALRKPIPANTKHMTRRPMRASCFFCGQAGMPPRSTALNCNGTRKPAPSAIDSGQGQSRQGRRVCVKATTIRSWQAGPREASHTMPRRRVCGTTDVCGAAARTATSKHAEGTNFRGGLYNGRSGRPVKPWWRATPRALRKMCKVLSATQLRRARCVKRHIRGIRPAEDTQATQVPACRCRQLRHRV